MTERCLASGDEEEETGHSEESGIEGEVEWSERGELGVGSVGLASGVQATTSTVSPPMRQTRPRRVRVHRGGSSGEVMPLGAGIVRFHVGAAATVVPVPLATGSW